MNTQTIGWAALSLALALAVVAAPHAQEGRPHVGHAGRTWNNDFGVRAGRCDTAMLVHIVGTSTGTKAASPDVPAVGMLADRTLGATVGARPGRHLDYVDRACIGHALELAPQGRVVTWTSSATSVSYTLTPVRNAARGCRQFRLVARRGGETETTTQLACTNGDGRWALR